MSKKIFKESMRALKVFKNSDLEISEICIHMETDDGEILEIDIDIDEISGELNKEFNSFENEEEYEMYLESDDDIPEGILYN
jgi:hypothetical protein|tara:strand:+ start:315 stop:560 length:246 start_codon:yes stop_codon:yes gene_type:complete